MTDEEYAAMAAKFGLTAPSQLAAQASAPPDIPEASQFAISNIPTGTATVVGRDTLNQFATDRPGSQGLSTEALRAVMAPSDTGPIDSSSLNKAIDSSMQYHQQRAAGQQASIDKAVSTLSDLDATDEQKAQAHSTIQSIPTVYNRALDKDVVENPVPSKSSLLSAIQNQFPDMPGADQLATKLQRDQFVSNITPADSPSIAALKAQTNLNTGPSYRALQDLGIEFPGSTSKYATAPLFQPDAPGPAQKIQRAVPVPGQTVDANGKVIPAPASSTGLTVVRGTEFGQIDNPSRGGYTEAGWNVGAWGGDLADTKTPFVALPEGTLGQYGNPSDKDFADKFNSKYDIQVVDPTTGKTVVSTLRDKGPGAKTGAGIDMSWGTREQLGLKPNFSGNVSYRIVPKGSALPDNTTASVQQTKQNTEAAASYISNPRYNAGADLKGTDSRLAQIVVAAADGLPAGYTVRPTSGMRHSGQGQHTVGNATDWEIVGPNGEVIPNRGGDKSGLYTQLARNAYGYQEQNFPELTGKFQWGGQFGTSSQNPNEPDLMHFDIGGRRGRIEQYSREKIGAVLPPSPTANQPSGQQPAAVSGDQQFTVNPNNANERFIQPIDASRLKDPSVHGTSMSTGDVAQWARHQADEYAGAMDDAGTPLTMSEYKEQYQKFFEGGQKYQNADIKLDAVPAEHTDQFSSLANLVSPTGATANGKTLSQLDLMEKSFLAAKKALPIGAMQQIGPYSEERRMYESQQEHLVPNIARGLMGQKGNLSEAEQQGARKTLPEAGDSEELGQQKMAVLRQSIQDQMRRIIQINKAEHHDTSALEQQYRQIFVQPKAQQQAANEAGIDKTQSKLIANAPGPKQTIAPPPPPPPATLNTQTNEQLTRRSYSD